jgi:hypothetical protein
MLFVSYAHADSQLVETEINFLIDEGYDVWWDKDLNAMQDWSNEIARQIADCSVFVLFLSNNSLKFESFVKQELQFALSKRKPIMAIHLEPVSLPDDLELLTGNIQSLLRYEINTNDRRDYYLDKIKRALNKELRFSAVSQYITPVPPYEISKLVDRTEFIEDLHKQLDQGPGLFVITAMGGTGKTTLLQAYCNQPEFTKYYKHIAWITVTKGIAEDMLTTFDHSREAGFVRNEELSTDENFDNLIAYLTNLTGNNLLVIDNADDPENIESCEKKLASCRWKVIITSRARPEVAGKLIDLNQLELKYLRELFGKYYNKPDKESPLLNDLIAELGHHTLLIELIAKTAQSHFRLNIEKLLQLVKKAGLNTPELQIPVKLDHSNPRVNETKVKIHNYLNEIFSLSLLDEAEKQMLLYFSVFPISGIEFDLLCQLLDAEADSERDFEIQQTLRSLNEKGWINKHEGPGENSAYRILFTCHSTIQAVVHHHIKPDQYNCLVLAHNLGKISELSEVENWTEKTWLLPYIETLLNQVPQDKLIIEWATLIHHYAMFLLKKGFHQKALELIQEILSKINLQKISSKEWRVLEVKLLLVRGYCQGNLALHQESLISKIIAARLLAKELPGETLLHAKIYKALGNTFKNLSRFRWSVLAHQKALSLLEGSTCTESRIIYAQVIDNIGFTYSRQAKKDKASETALLQTSLEYRLKAYNMLKELLPDNHPALTVILNNIGVMYKLLAHYDEALDFQLKNLAIKQSYGIGSINTQRITHSNLSGIYCKTGEFDKALDHAWKAMEISELVFEQTHPQHIKTLAAYAAALHFSGQNQQALQYATLRKEMAAIKYKPGEIEYDEALRLIQSIEFALLEEEYWEFKKSINSSKDLQPVNLLEEKEKFLAEFAAGRHYDPTFTYESNNHLSQLESLQNFRKRFEASGFVLSSEYIKLIDENIEWIEHFANRDAAGFNAWLTSLYGFPNAGITQRAEQECMALDNLLMQEPDAEINASEAAAVFGQALADRGMNDWEIVLEETPARMSVNALQQRIKIKTSSSFSHNDIKRLLVHEIDTHVQRNQNGNKQVYKLFSYGFPDYLETEEGLALYAEQRTGTAAPGAPARYALRLLLCRWSENSGFSDLFMKALPHFSSPGKAFDSVARIKRGLSDTSLPGGYTKDQVYYSGFLKVSQLSGHIIHKLYCGKIGIQHLPLLDKLEYFVGKYHFPDWVRE